MAGHSMEYNSQKDLLIIPEYGRNVQLLIEYAKTIEDPEYRQAFTEKVVNLMHQMHPQNRNIEDYRARLWQHVFRIADYELDVMPPSGVLPTPEEYRKKPEQVEYPSFDTKYRHYGSNVQSLIKKAKEMEPGPKRDGFIAVIGSYMKLAYRTWNKEQYISDEVIKNDLEKLSDGVLILTSNASLDNLSDFNSGNSGTNRRRKRPSQNNGKNSGGSRGGGRNNYRNKRR